MVNKTELMALEYLTTTLGYSKSDIIKTKTPNFTCNNGKRYVTKYLYRDKIIFSQKQASLLKDTDTILVFDRSGLIVNFLWKQRNQIPLNIHIIPYTRNTITVDTDVLKHITSKKRQGETPNDTLRRILNLEVTQ